MEKNDLLIKAITKLRPLAEYSFTEDDYSTVKWYVLDGEAPTQKDIDAAIKEVKAEEAQVEAAKATAKAALLAQLGITEEQAKLLLS
jgi:hypothetical protein